jgi:hypothetical protein
MPIRLLLVALAALVLGGGVAAAQDQPTQAAPPIFRFPGQNAAAGTHPVTEASLAAARRLLEATNALDAIEKTIPQMMDSLIRPMARQRNLSEADTQALLDILTEEMRSDYPTLIEMSARAYAQHLSIPDMEAAIAFYESDAGRHITQKTPTIMNEMMAVGQAWGEHVLAPRVVARVTELTRQGKLQTP